MTIFAVLLLLVLFGTVVCVAVDLMLGAKTNDLLREFFRILDIVEESDSGRPFRPNYFSSCRAHDAARMEEILAELKQRIAA